MKVIYILGLGHSGTTVLDLLLSQHPAAIGIGEALRFVKGHTKNYEQTSEICSCGKALNQCEFWSALESLRGSGRDDHLMKAAYRKIFAQAAACGATTVIDSSKHSDGVRVLSQLEQEGQIELSVLFLVRDVRGWVCSSQKSARRAGMFPRPAWMLIPRWYREQQKMIEEVRRYHPSFIFVRYEKLCANPKEVLDELREKVGLSFFDFAQATTARSHIMMGNRLKMGTSFPIQVSCDEQWKKKLWLRFWLHFFPHIARWNRKMTT